MVHYGCSERSREQAGATFNILNARRLTISSTISFLSQSLYGILAHLKTLHKCLESTQTLKLTCTRQPHPVRHLPGLRRSRHLPAPRSTSTFREAPPPGCTLQSKMDRWSPPEKEKNWKLKAEVSSSPCSPEGFQGQCQSLCSPLHNCKNATILYLWKLQTIYLYLNRSYDLLGGNSVLTNNLY